MDSSDKTPLEEKKATIQPHDDSIPSKVTGGLKATMEAIKGNPGPAIPKDFNVQQEGTKEERRAKAAELNK